MPTIVSTYSSTSSHRGMAPSQAPSQTRTIYTVASPSVESPPASSTYSSSSKRRRGSSPSTPVSSGGTFSSYTPTTVSSYERRMANVKGMPARDYFSSGRSKTDRQSAYVTPPTTPSSPGSIRSGHTARGSAVGKEMVKYRQTSYEDHSGDDDDARTLTPYDSISQISSNVASSVSRGRRSRRDSGYGGSSAGGNPAGLVMRSGGGSGSSTFSGLSTFQGGQVYDRDRGFYLEERRPRASAR